MTDVQLNGHREDAPPLAPPIATVPRDTSFEHPLDEDAPGPSRSTTATASPSRGSAGNGCRSSRSTCAPGRPAPHGGRVSRRGPLPHLVPPAALAEVPAARRRLGGRRRGQDRRRAAAMVVGHRAVLPAVQGRGRRQLAGMAGAAHARDQAPLVARRRARRRAGRHPDHVPGDRRAVPLAGVAGRRRGRHAAARARRAAGGQADHRVGGDDAAGPQDQHRRHRPRLRRRGPVQQRPEEAGRPPRVRLHHVPRPARPGQSGHRVPAVRQDVLRRHHRQAQDRVRPGRERVPGLPHAPTRTPSGVTRCGSPTPTRSPSPPGRRRCSTSNRAPSGARHRSGSTSTAARWRSASCG